PAVDEIGQRRDREGEARGYPPTGLEHPGDDDERDEDRHQDQPQRGERVGGVEHWRTPDHRRGDDRGFCGLAHALTRSGHGRGAADTSSTGTAMRSTPSVPVTVARTRSPGRNAATSTPAVGAATKVVDPSTSGAWCAAQPSTCPSSTEATSTSTVLPTRSSARCEHSSSASAHSLSRS